MRVRLSLYDSIAAGRLAKPLRAELWDALLSLEVHVDEPETVSEAVKPLEVVLRAPEEVAVDRHAFRRGALELTQAGAQEHQPVRVVNPAVGGHDIRRRAAVYGEED